MNNYDRTSEYIKSSWLKAVKRKDIDETFPLPFDYIPPCVDGTLTNLYYWDTYFTNIGLYIDELPNYAYNNIENLKFCLRKFGCVPNMCRANGADYASQPPLLFLMVNDYYKNSEDIKFLEDSYEALSLEYKFWMTERMSPSGLNRYGTNNKNRKILIEAANSFANRVGLGITNFTDEMKIELSINRTAEGESGEDHTNRFGGVANEINPIDLNSYLYGFEVAMNNFSLILSKGEEKAWRDRAAKRKELIDKYCLDRESGIYFDYNFIKRETTKIYSAASYLPYVFSLTENKSAIEKINKKLIYSYGTVSCEKLAKSKEVFQWGYPNMWAPHNYYAYTANKKAGSSVVADEIAKKYLITISNEFIESGKLYEKYDAAQGGKATVNEYGVPEMLGWTAGVYEYFYSLYKDNI